MHWEPAAEARMKKAPVFMRPFLEGRAEKQAKARNRDRVTEALLDEVKSQPAMHWHTADLQT